MEALGRAWVAGGIEVIKWQQLRLLYPAETLQILRHRYYRDYQTEEPGCSESNKWAFKTGHKMTGERERCRGGGGSIRPPIKKYLLRLRKGKRQDSVNIAQEDLLVSTVQSRIF